MFSKERPKNKGQRLTIWNNLVWPFSFWPPLGRTIGQPLTSFLVSASFYVGRIISVWTSLDIQIWARGSVNGSLALFSKYCKVAIGNLSCWSPLLLWSTPVAQKLTWQAPCGARPLNENLGDECLFWWVCSNKQDQNGCFVNTYKHLKALLRNTSCYLRYVS